jgi:hypothetical protein
MAENEILDMGSRRWRPTRAALANPDLSLSAVAEVVANDLESQLSKALRSGQTLLMIFDASHQEPAAMRAAVQSFKDQQLARIARDAIKVAPGKDPASIAHCVTDMLIAQLIDRTRLLAHQSGWGSEKREALMKVLQQEFESRRMALAAVTEQSLRGQPARQVRRGRADRDASQVDASTLVRRPLLMPMGGGNSAPGRN